MRFNIKNWSEFQQYKDDRPLHWIKLHTKLLSDYSFNQLPELTQLHLLKLWLVAADSKGTLEGDETWLAKLINAKKLDISRLVQDGFLVRTDSYDTVPREEERREEEREKKGTQKERTPCPYQQIIDLYHEKLPMLPKVVTLSETRKASIKARWNNGAPNLKFWEDYFDSVSESKWMTGQVDPSPGRKQFIADIDFLIRESTIIKTQEGKYHG